MVLSDEIRPPDSNYHLLVAFRFGKTLDPDFNPAVVDTRLATLSGKAMYECWWVAEPVAHKCHGEIRIAECADYAVMIQDTSESAQDELVTRTRAAYLDLFDALRSTRHRHVVKIWNYIGAINEGDGDNERYRKFSTGRAMAFAEFDIPNTAAPAATGIGTPNGSGLLTITLTSRHAPAFVENPRQISAFQYPRVYGPSSPKFARGATVVSSNHTLQLLSGTAAIVGHESLHAHNTQLQLDETLRNISALSESLSILDGGGVFRVYLKNAADKELVVEKIQTRLQTGKAQVMFLQGDICRRELMIEIDGARVQ